MKHNIDTERHDRKFAGTSKISKENARISRRTNDKIITSKALKAWSPCVPCTKCLKCLDVD